MRIAIEVEYVLHLTREEFALVTKGLTGHLHLADPEKKEPEKAKELGIRILEQQAMVLEHKRDAAAHAFSIAVDGKREARVPSPRK